MSRSIKTTGAALLLLICLALAAGCGQDTTTAPEAEALPGGNTDLMMVDASPSFRRSARGFVPDMVAVAQASASQRRVLWVGCVDGAPLRTLRWTIRVDFGELPASVENATGLAERINTARALGLRPQFIRLIRHTPDRVPGSGLLEALELAAQTEDVGRVFIFTDALTFEPDSVHLARASDAELQATARRWVKRLHGLRGVEVLMIGVGREARTTVAVRNAERLFRAVVTGAGGRLRWSQELPASFGEATS
jgi:hypothetical protein